MSITRIGRHEINLEAIKKLSKKDLRAFLANKPTDVVEAVQEFIGVPKKKSIDVDKED